MKHLTTAVIILMLGFGACSKSSPEKDFVVEPVEGGRSIKITDYIGTKWNVKIPSKIRGLPVTHIGDLAFHKKNLVSVTIPNGVTNIGINAFSGNQLTNITIPNGVISIGNSAFTGNQLTNITIPSSVINVGVNEDIYRNRSRNVMENVAFPNMVADMFVETVNHGFLSSTQYKFKPGNWIFRDGKWSSGGETTQGTQKQNKSSDKSGNTNPLVGKWEISNRAGLYGWEFFKDGKGWYHELNDNESFPLTWREIGGGKLLISIDGNNQTVSYEIRGNELIVDGNHGLQKVNQFRKPTQAVNQPQQVQSQQQQTRLSGTYWYNGAGYTFTDNDFSWNPISGEGNYSGNYEVSGNRVFLNYRECCCSGEEFSIPLTIVDSNTLRNDSGELFIKK